MVSTSRNKSCKILSCLGEIVFFYSEFFASGNHYRNVQANFQRKTFLLLVEISQFFWLVKNSFFHLSDIPGCEISFSVKWKLFCNKFFIPASGNKFSLQWKEFFFLLFRTLLKLLKFRGANRCLWKLIFWLVELIFSHFSDTLSSESYYFPSSGNVFLNESFNTYD